MSDPLRTTHSEVTPQSSDAEGDRDGKIEHLLLAGLDHYFAADYSQAIDVWSRALFLDRGHARARAYIERARSAMAEEQRESDELLHNGVAAFERGDLEAARQLLNAAVERGGAHDVALAFLTRIDRLSAAVPPAEAAPAAAARQSLRASAPTPPLRRKLWPAAATLVIIGAGVIAAATWDEWRESIASIAVTPAPEQVPSRNVQEPLRVPRSADTALARARALFESGRPHDALHELEKVRAADPLRDDADRLKAAIQRELLVHHALPAGRAVP